MTRQELLKHVRAIEKNIDFLEKETSMMIKENEFTKQVTDFYLIRVLDGRIEVAQEDRGFVQRALRRRFRIGDTLDISKAIGVTNDSLWKYETGHRKPSDKTWNRILEYFRGLNNNE